MDGERGAGFQIGKRQKKANTYTGIYTFRAGVPGVRIRVWFSKVLRSV